MRKGLQFILFLLLLLGLTTCINLGVNKPNGFAEIKCEEHYRAVSPEGMLYRVRVLKNYPKQDLDFWSEALKNHLIKEGYSLTIDGEAFQAGNHHGRLYEWVVPYGNESYIYLTAILLFEETIAVAEAAGEHTVYLKYRESLKNSLKSITLR